MSLPSVRPLKPENKLELLARLGLLACWVIPLFFYHALPDTIATHFDINGQANGYSSRAGIWGLPVIITITYLVLTLAGKVSTTQQNTQTASVFLKKLTKKLLQVLKLEITVLTAITTYCIMLVATGKLSQMPEVLLPVFLGSIFGTIILYFWKANQLTKI